MQDDNDREVETLIKELGRRECDWGKVAPYFLRLLRRNSWEARGAKVEMAFHLVQEGEAALGAVLYRRALAVIDATAALELALSDLVQWRKQLEAIVAASGIEDKPTGRTRPARGGGERCLI